MDYKAECLIYLKSKMEKKKVKWNKINNNIATIQHILIPHQNHVLLFQVKKKIALTFSSFPEYLLMGFGPWKETLTFNWTQSFTDWNSQNHFSSLDIQLELAQNHSSLR